MRLAPGTGLGPYEIVGVLGEGGMGEVYRARDHRLNRDVAVKIIRSEAGGDAGAQARFEREARAVAALSHPNILAVYDFGRDDGIVYLVTELLEGQTLGRRLTSGPLPWRKALEIGAHIARGLAAAHAQGVVHRDLKPDNVFLTRDGQVKILDFGLAKVAAASSGALPDRTVTRAGPVTHPGVVMGTVGYMAPEQVRGLPADARADLFALGAILYECLTAERAFRGPSAADVMSAILNEAPPETGPDVPASVMAVLRRCLEKNPEERFQSASDLAFDLERLSADTAASGATMLPDTRARPGRKVWAPALLALVGVSVLVAGAYLEGRRGARVEPPTFQRLTFQRGAIRSAYLAPDGQTVLYGAAWEGEPIRIFTTRLGSPASQPLDLPDADVLAVSSRGELAISLGRRFLSPHESRGTLARVPLSGGAPKLLLENVQQADWSPDGNALAAVHDFQGRNRLEYPIGTVLFETPGWVSWPRVSPDGRQVAFFEHEVRWDNGGYLAVVDRSGNVRRLTGFFGNAEGLAWRADGREVWFTAAMEGTRSLRAANLQGESRTIYRQATDLSLLDLDAGGRVLMASSNQRRETYFVEGPRSRNLSWLDWSLCTFLSRDGAWILINEQGDGSEPGYSIYLRRTDGGLPVHIGSGVPIAISPDGRWVLARVYEDGKPIMRLYPTGPGTVEDLGPTAGNHWAAFLPDSRRILYTSDATPPRLVMAEIGGESREMPWEDVAFDAFSDPVAPDGASFVGRRGWGPLMRFPLGGGEPEVVRGLTEQETAIRFGPRGRWLYFYRRGMPAVVGRVELATGRREEIAEIAPADRAGAVGIWPALVSEDGSKIAYSYPRFLSTLVLVEGLE